MKTCIGFIFCISLLSGNLIAEEKKNIQVRFTITEPQYKTFYEAETDLIERKCTSLMVDFLNTTYGFFQFTTETNQTILHIELTDNERNLSARRTLKEVGFKMYIKQQGNLVNAEPVYWVFRPVERYIESLPDVKEEFIDEVFQTFKIGVANNKEQLVKNILSKVEVADNFYFLEDKKWFILPLTEKENNIANLSLFLIITSVHDDLIGSKESEVITKVVGNIKKEVAVQTNNLPVTYPIGSLVVEKDKNDDEGIPIGLSNDNLIGKKIFILKYLPLVNSNIDIISPQTLTSSSNQ